MRKKAAKYRTGADVSGSARAVQVRLPIDVFEQLAEAAARDHRSLSGQAVVLIEQAFAKAA